MCFSLTDAPVPDLAVLSAQFSPDAPFEVPGYGTLPQEPDPVLADARAAGDPG